MFTKMANITFLAKFLKSVILRGERDFLCSCELSHRWGTGNNWCATSCGSSTGFQLPSPFHIGCKDISEFPPHLIEGGSLLGGACLVCGLSNFFVSWNFCRTGRMWPLLCAHRACGSSASLLWPLLFHKARTGNIPLLRGKFFYGVQESSSH